MAVVKLGGSRRDKYGPDGAFRIRRAPTGSGREEWMTGSAFLVEFVDAKGVPDFRRSAGFCDYDKALAEANDCARPLRLPVVDITGIASDPPAPPAQRPKTKGANREEPARKPGPTIWAKEALKAKGIDVTDLSAWKGDGRYVTITEAFCRQARGMRRNLTAIFEGAGGGHEVQYRQCDHDAVSHMIGDLLAYTSYLGTQVKDQADAIRKLQEAKPARGMVYRGVWQAGTHAKRGDTYTHGGSIWHCDKATEAKPGDDPAGWTLCCKRGADGRDAR